MVTVTAATTAKIPMEQPDMKGLAGPNIMILGDAGTGKTYSIASAVEAGLPVFYIALENGLEALLGYWLDRGLPVPKNLCYMEIKSPNVGFDTLLKSATRVNTSTLKMLADALDPDRDRYNQFILTIKAFSNFVDDATGTVFGPVDKFPAGCMVVVDSLTILSTAAMTNFAGGRSLLNLADYQLGQRQLENILRKLVDGCRCWFVLLSHIERETDQITGSSRIMASTIGAKMAPKLGPMFSDIILSIRSGKKFTWDTEDPQAALKTRSLKIARGMEQTFLPIVTTWANRGGIIATNWFESKIEKHITERQNP